MRSLASLLLITAALVSLGANVAQAQRKLRPTPTALTLQAGREIPWHTDLSEALVVAKKKLRPVFWYVPTVRGSRMDRKPEIDHYMMSGPFAAPEVADLISRCFIPVKQRASGDAQKKYGLRNGKFIEPGFLILDPDGRELFRIDQITTIHTEWWVAHLRRQLDSAGDLGRPSAKVESAAKAGDLLAYAQAFEAEGRLDEAKEVLSAQGPRAEKEAGSFLLLARIARRRGDLNSAERYLTKTGDIDGKLTEAMRLALAKDDALACVKAFEAATEQQQQTSEALLLKGVALHFLRRETEGQKAWKELVAKNRPDRWTRKASAELQRLGPTSRAFERWDRLPDDALVKNPDGTRRPRTRAQAKWLAQRSVELLLRHQRSDGGWDDSNYDFGGTASLPNVYVAGTALAAKALLEWRHINPEAVDVAVDAALDYLLDETNIAAQDKNEIVWAHAYRLIFLDQYLQSKGPKQKRARKQALDIVKTLLATQNKSGAWRHEYPNPFATASVVHALHRIAERKVPVGKDALKRAAKALLACRAENGTFSYGMRGRGGSPEGSGGRMPLCEYALLITGASDQQKLTKAIETSFAQHKHLAAVRKYDDHADRYANGGFFFWYDLFGRSAAIEGLTDTAAKRTFQRKMEEIILSLPEFDGGFVDSHELGKTYGTAMGLITLKQALVEKP